MQTVSPSFVFKLLFYIKSNICMFFSDLGQYYIFFNIYYSDIILINKCKGVNIYEFSFDIAEFGDQRQCCSGMGQGR